MAESDSNAELREMMRDYSTISGFDRSGARAIEIIQGTLGTLLEPGERVIGYADRRLASVNQTDAYAYAHDEPNGETDAVAYPRKDGSPQVDALAYDTERGREQMDVLGYRGREVQGQTDAFAYVHWPQGSDVDILVSDAAGPRAADVDLLVLTDKRLLRGILENEKLMVAEVPSQVGEVGVAVAEIGSAEDGSPDGTVYVAITIPPRLCRPAENDVWQWQVPEGKDPRVVAEQWAAGHERA